PVPRHQPCMVGAQEYVLARAVPGSTSTSTSTSTRVCPRARGAWYSCDDRERGPGSMAPCVRRVADRSRDRGDGGGRAPTPAALAALAPISRLGEGQAGRPSGVGQPVRVIRRE